jgi:hypothetical protein
MSAEPIPDVDLRDVVEVVIAYARRHHPEALSSDLLIDVRTRDGYRVFATSVHQLRLTAGPPPGMAPPPAGVLAAAAEPARGSGPTLTDTQEAIEAVLRLTDKPIKVATIASRANRVFNSHFRAEMGRLRRAGRVVVTPEHRYWLADRGKPPT